MFALLNFPTIMPRLSYIAIPLLLVCVALPALAQEEETSLGDLARSIRKTKPAEDKAVIDNDNLTVMMDKAESERLNGKPVFSIDPSGKTFRMTSPDGTCSLSFDARAASLVSTPFIASDLPQDEIAKLQGPGSVQDGAFEVELHNGSKWELKEIVVGITVLKSGTDTQLHNTDSGATSDQSAPQKTADVTTLYHLKADSPPDSTTTFRGLMENADLAGKDWHWALVAARGIPPAASENPAPQQQATAPTVPSDITAASQPSATPQPDPPISRPAQTMVVHYPSSQTEKDNSATPSQPPH